jgi:hypothetical protein
MTERRGDQGFSVAPQRLGGAAPDGRSRRPRRRPPLAVIGVVAAAVAVVGLALVGERLTQRPNLDIGYLATPTPRFTPSPSPSRTGPAPTPRTTPLPPLTRPEGVEVDGRLAVVTEGMRILDLATGESQPGPSVQLGRDGVFPSPSGDGWSCLCFLTGEGPENAAGLALLSIDPSGSFRKVSGRERPALSNIAWNDTRNVDLDLAADRRRGIAATSLQLDPDGGWTLSAAAIDAARGRRGELVELGTIESPPGGPAPGASPSPSPIGEVSVYLAGPFARMAPDGRSAYVWGTAQRSGPDSLLGLSKGAWRITFAADGSIDEVAEAPALLDLPTYCAAIGYFEVDQFGWACPDYVEGPVTTGGEHIILRLLDADGRPGASRSIPNNGAFDSQPMLDRANDLLYLWSGWNRTLSRLDLVTLDLQTAIVDPEARNAPGITTGGSRTPEWYRFDSLINPAWYGQMVGEPGGTRLFLAASQDSSGPMASYARSLGVFVADASTLAILDRWAPAANYASVAIPRPGLVAGLGMPGADVEGREAPWQGSLTLHDMQTGTILARYAQFGEGNLPFIIGP